MSSYDFSKTGVNKIGALQREIENGVPYYSYFNYNGDTLTIVTTQALTTEELQTVQTLVDNYVDPEYFLTLTSSATDATRSYSTNSLTPEVVQSFIYTATDSLGNGTFNAIKTVIEYKTENVETWSTFTGPLTINFRIRCFTRDYLLSNNTITITDIGNTWKTAALNLETGKRSEYRTFMVEGLRNYVANYDCIWVYEVAVSDPRLYVTLHSKQMLYYNIE